MKKKILIVGGVAGGASAAARLRRLSEEDEIIMFERGPHVSFSNCALPYHLSGLIDEADRLVLMSPEKFLVQYNIQARVNKDLTIEFNSHHGVITKLSGIPKIGILVESKNKNTASKARVALVDTYDFSPDDWIGYITPLVDDALEEATGGVSLEHLFQKYIMVGILVGQGMTFKEATNEIEN